MSRKRSASGSRGRVRITPHSTRETVAMLAPSPLTTPYPVVAVPGSMPRTITMRRRESSVAPRHFGHVHVEVRPDLLNVVELFERLEQLEQRIAVLAGDHHRVLRDHRQLG